MKQLSFIVQYTYNKQYSYAAISAVICSILLNYDNFCHNFDNFYQFEYKMIPRKYFQE